MSRIIQRIRQRLILILAGRSSVVLNVKIGKGLEIKTYHGALINNVRFEGLDVGAAVND